MLRIRRVSGSDADAVRRLAALGAGLLALFLTGYLVAEAVGVPWLSSPPPLSAAVGVGLLVGDALLPVPASVVMVALGGIVGFLPAVGLALAGRVGGTMLGFALGRLIPQAALPSSGERAAALLHRWGPLAVLVTRPVPLVGETVAVLAGASGMGWARCALAATVGALPEAVLYSWAGAVIRGST